MRKPKVIFAIQGEGHGHMTQALKAAKILRKNHFDICAVFLGNNNNTLIPESFRLGIDCPIIPIKSLELQNARDQEHTYILNSILNNIGKVQSSKTKHSR